MRDENGTGSSLAAGVDDFTAGVDDFTAGVDGFTAGTGSGVFARSRGSLHPSSTSD